MWGGDLTLPIVVPPTGPQDARIAIVGEAPGADEERLGKPFVGAAGRLLDTVLSSVGINRAECYVTNVMLVRPPKNDFGHFYVDSRRHEPRPELLEGRARLHEELARIRPNVIFALGVEALKALTGRQDLSIGDWRGSILSTPAGKVVPSYHPAAVLRQWSWFPILRLDAQRVAEESTTPDVNLPQRTLVTHPTLTDVRAFLDVCKRAEYLSFDIETIRRDGKLFVDCLGLAPQADYAMCIPFCYTSGEPYWTLADEAEVWRLVSDVLADPTIKKIGQNAQYDMLVLRRHGVRVANLWLDTMNAMHVVYPELPKALDFLCSVFTREPFYKDQIRTNRWRYNALDAAVTYEVAFKLLDEMREFGVEEFYFRHVHPLIGVFIDIQEHGVRIDREKVVQARAQLEGEIAALQAQIDALAGHPLNVNSPKQMCDYLYRELKLPVTYNKAGNPTANEEALERLYHKTGRRELELCLELRHKKKLLSTYINMPCDPDGRVRTTYLLTGTETGRLASRESVDGTGGNLQNVPKGIAREIFVPDPGCVFVGADLAQAEARVVAWLAEDPNMMRVFNEGGDVHVKNAAMIFGKPESEVTKDERQLAKRVVHASNYGMGPRLFAQFAGITEREARRLQDQYFAAFPRIKLWHKRVEEEIGRTRVLQNPFGRKRMFFGRYGPDLFKEAFAYIPQSTVADVLHRATYAIYCRLPEGARIVLQVHDALVVQCREDQVDEVKAIVKEELERPFMCNGKPLSIPADVKVGNNWNEV